MTAANASCDNHTFSGRSSRKLQGEPTLEEILAGPIVRAIMLADHVDAEALTAMLRSVGLRLRERTRAPLGGAEISAVPRLGAEGGRS